MVELTKHQAEALESLKDKQTPSEIVRDYIVKSYKLVHPIYELSLDTLIKALYVEYTVKY